MGCTLSASPLAGILGRELADSRPIKPFAAMGQQGQETVAQDVGERQFVHFVSPNNEYQNPALLGI